MISGGYIEEKEGNNRNGNGDDTQYNRTIPKAVYISNTLIVMSEG